jgi:putative phosphoribosyl transferase
VAYEVARALQAPLDIWVVRKVGVPGQPELGAGAVAEGGVLYLSPDVMAAVGVSKADLASVIERERSEVQRRVRRFRDGRPRPELKDRTVIVVDDGIATGGTVRAALRAIRSESPRKVVLAVPVAAPGALEDMAEEVDQVVCLLAPPALQSIGAWYTDFSQVDEDEVLRLLDEARSST